MCLFIKWLNCIRERERERGKDDKWHRDFGASLLQQEEEEEEEEPKIVGR